MNQNILLAMPSATELLIVFGMVLVIFGGSKIPKLMGGFGKGIKEFKKGIGDNDSDTNSENEEPKVAVAEKSEKTKQLKENSES